MIHIRAPRRNNGYANLYSLDLVTHTKKNITKNSNENINYYLSKVNADNKLLYEKNEDDKIIVILEDIN